MLQVSRCVSDKIFDGNGIVIELFSKSAKFSAYGILRPIPNQINIFQTETAHLTQDISKWETCLSIVTRC